jgi:DNA-binding HxlR family transcriptional regulator
MRSASKPGSTSRAGGDANAPILAVIDLLGQRWMLRVLWELEPGQLGFLELRRRMGNCSSSMLSDRLQQLQAAGLTEKNSAGEHELTTAGSRLAESLQPLWDWSERQTSDLHPFGSGR